MHGANMKMVCNLGFCGYTGIVIRLPTTEKVFFSSQINPDWVLGPTHTSFNLATKVVSP